MKLVLTSLAGIALILSPFICSAEREIRHELPNANRLALLYQDAPAHPVRFTTITTKQKVIAASGLAALFLTSIGFGILNDATHAPESIFSLPQPDSFGSKTFAINADVAGSAVGYFGPTCTRYNATSPALHGCPPYIRLSFNEVAPHATAETQPALASGTYPCRSEKQVEEKFPLWCKSLQKPSFPHEVAKLAPRVRLQAKIKALQEARSSKK